MGHITWTREDRSAARHYRRARRYQAPGDFDSDEWAIIVAWWGKCLVCGTRDDLTVDHVVPLSRGGSNGVSNLQPLCGPCNSRKGRRIIDYRDPLALVQLLEVL